MALLKNLMKRSIGEHENFPPSGLSISDLPFSFYDGTYTKLSDNPEVIAGVNVISDLVSNMTIRLMTNAKNGDERVNNELSRKLDISPNEFMTRKTLIYNITREMLLTGNQITFPEYGRDGHLANLHPVESENIEYIKLKKHGYAIEIKDKRYKHNDLLHFVLNPGATSPYVGSGYGVPLNDLLSNLKSASNMKRTFMGGRYTPPVIVSVDATAKELNTKKGRDEILEQYIETTGAGKPWVIPGGMMTVETVKPLTLRDVAINETVQLDKRTVAAILGMPPYLLGVGDFNRDEYNNFIETKIKSIATILEQEMTRKLIISKDMFIKFNTRSLKSFAQDELVTMSRGLHSQGLMTGNEVRDWIDLDPMDDLNELTMLENYLPIDELGNQKKLKDTIKKEMTKGGD